MVLNKRKLLWFDSLYCTLLTFIVSFVFYIFFLNISVLDPFYKAFKDFSITDLYYSKLFENNSKIKDVIIVNIKRNNRFTIAQAIEKVHQQKPNVIGLDLIFKDKKNTFFDSILKNTLYKTDNVISSFILDSDSIIKNNDYFNSNPAKEGFINVSHSGQDAVIRNFIGIRNEEKKYYSFATRVALESGLLDNKNLKKLEEPLPINYLGNQESFLTFDIEELLELEKIPVMKDAIVIFGYLGTPSGNMFDIEDKHFTPLNKKYVGRSTPDMFGVLIHANIVKMLIGNRLISKVPILIVYIIALISCFFSILYGMILYKRSEFVYDVLIKIIQFVISVVLIYMALLLQKINIYLYITPILILTLLGLEMIDFYAYLLDYLKKRYKWKSYLLN